MRRGGGVTVSLCDVIPSVGLYVVVRSASTVIVRMAKVKLCFGIALVGGLSESFHGLLEV